MLGLQLKLTAAQVKVLMILTYRTQWREGERNPLPLELAEMPSFLNTTAALERRGLIKHMAADGWRVTAEGEAIASLVYQNARSLVAIVEETAVAETTAVEAAAARGEK